MNNEEEIYKPLKRRFYILITFGLFSFIPGYLFNVWQPVMESLKFVFHWNLTEINMLSNTYAIVYLIGMVPFIYLWNAIGLKLIFHLSVIILMFGNFVRLVPCSPEVLGVLIQISNVITAVASLMALIGMTVISSLWFPSKERVKATSFSFGMNALGSALAPSIASHMVPMYSRNETTTANISSIEFDNILSGIHNLNYFNASIAFLVLTLVTIYFPSRPPILPCRSALPDLRINLLDGVKALFRNRRFWCIIFVNFIMNGISIGVNAVFTSLILPLGLLQEEVGTLNTVVSIFVFFGTLMGGWLGDRFNIRKVVLICALLTSIGYIIWGLQCIKLIPHNMVSIYIVAIVANFIASISGSIIIELVCETAFPVSEEVSSAIMSGSINLGIMIFLCITMIPNIGVAWIPFSYGVLVLLVIPLMWTFNTKCPRREIDDNFEVFCTDVEDDDDDDNNNESKGSEECLIVNS